MEKFLYLKDNNDVVQGKITSFTYSAKRMGGAPSITADFLAFDVLEITTDWYVEFNGERYYVKQTPTSSKSNSDARYKYNLELVSERIMLDEVYFHNASWSTVSGVSKAISKGSNFSFIGSIKTLADRINASLAFSKIEKYKVVVSDEFTEVEDKFIQFSDVFVSNAIQEFYNTFKIPYYFYWDENEGKTIIFVTNGSAKSPTVSFEYGKDNALLSITKTNANYKIINKCTGVGSSENLPYYYPNVSATGEHTFNADADFGDVRINYDILDKHTNLRDGATLTYHKKPSEVLYNYLVVYRKWERSAANITSEDLIQIDGATSLKGTSSANLQTDGYFKAERVSIEFTAQANDEVSFAFQQGIQTIDGTDGVVDEESVRLLYEIKEGDALAYVGKTVIASTALNDGVFSFTAAKSGTYSASVYILFKVKGGSQKKEIPLNLSATFTPYRKVYKEDYFTFDDNNKEIGVSLSGVTVTTPKDGGKIVVSETKNWIEPQQVLMPFIYRETNGVERYYIASNEPVTSEGHTYDFNGHQFTNPYAEGRPKEHIITVDDLKPTIKGMLVNDERIDMFSAFDYDVNDNDEIDEENHYKHQFFYAKLKKLDFNLFDQASEKGEMTISFTSGKCASCSFTIVVDENTKKNLVQVDDSGNLVFDENGVVKQISPYQSKQQDTINNEVWIALRKEDSTMGVVMPNVSNKAKPATEDTFVITNINLPLEYIKAAEQRLEERIKQYLIENNDDKFNFSIKFSRIYLAEEKNKDVRDNISENSSLTVVYQGKESLLYVSSYTYKITGGEALPEISVELSDTLATNNGVMRNVINRVKMEVMTSVSNVDVVAQGARAFIRKDQNDQTVYRLTANELNVNTDSNVGGSLDVSSNATVGGELSVERKASFRDNLEVGADITVGDYQEILGEVQGAKISQQGDGVFRSLRASSLEIATLIYNQIRATSARTVFDDTATIIEVTSEDIDGNIVYTLVFEGDENYIQPFQVNDIIYGYVNAINNYGHSTSGQCWMNVREIVSDSTNAIKVVLFDDDQVPNGLNIPPTTNMLVAHRGNNGTGEEAEKRQNTFYISTEDGNIIQLMGVNKPKLLEIKDGYSNYGVVIGKLPADLLAYIQNSYSIVKKDDPILYAKYLAVQNLLQIDYLGRPIKTERYRGVWNENIALGKVEGEEVYRSYYATDVTYYDTVTYDGSKWQCYTDKTENAPNRSKTDWTIMVEKGDSNKPQYEIKPSVNSIYYREATKSLSVDTLTVAIGETTSTGYRLITAQNELEQCGYHVEYSIKKKDGTVTDRTTINISMYGMIGTEDGLGVVATEYGQILWLEGDIIEVIDSYDEINLHLISNETGEERASTTVPIIYDGTNAISAGITPSNIPIMVDPNEDVMPSLEDIDVELKVYVRLGNELVDPDSELLDGEGWDFDLETFPTGLSYDRFDTQYIYFRFRLPKGTQNDEIPSIITIPLVKLESREPIGGVSVSISKSQRGIVGKQGEAGPIPIMRGWYDPTIAYKLERNSAGKVVGKPIVSKKEGNGDTTRYMLEKDIPDDVRVENDVVIAGTYPNIIEVGLGTAYWAMATRGSFLDAEILFANFASFGGENGAVFYDRYLFSQDGIDINGNDSDWTKHASADDTLPMFNEDGNFTGNFVPHFMVNLKKGVTKSNKFHEPFIQLPNDPDNNILRISFPNENGEFVERGYNVAVQPRVFLDSTNKIATSPACIFMSYGGVIKDFDGKNVEQNIDWDTDGANSTIIVKANNIYLGERYSKYGIGWSNVTSYVVVLIADGRYADYRSYASLTNSNGDGYIDFNPEREDAEIVGDGIINHGSHFIVGGAVTQMLFLMPGDIVKMKSCVGENGETDWYIENSFDFGIIPAYIDITVGKTINETEEKKTFRLGSNRTSPILYEGAGEAAFGSKAIFEIAGGSIGNINWTGKSINMYLDLERNLIS